MIHRKWISNYVYRTMLVSCQWDKCGKWSMSPTLKVHFGIVVFPVDSWDLPPFRFWWHFRLRDIIITLIGYPQLIGLRSYILGVYMWFSHSYQLVPVWWALFFLGRQRGLVVRAWTSWLNGQWFKLSCIHFVAWKESICFSVDFINIANITPLGGFILTNFSLVLNELRKMYSLGMIKMLFIFTRLLYFFIMIMY